MFPGRGTAMRARGEKNFPAMRAMPGMPEVKRTDEKLVSDAIRERRRTLEIGTKNLARHMGWRGG